jgi:hypothetical protein
MARWVERGLDEGRRQDAIEHMAACRSCRWCWIECLRSDRPIIEELVPARTATRRSTIP